MNIFSLFDSFTLSYHICNISILRFCYTVFTQITRHSLFRAWCSPLKRPQGRNASGDHNTMRILNKKSHFYQYLLTEFPRWPLSLLLVEDTSLFLVRLHFSFSMLLDNELNLLRSAFSTKSHTHNNIHAQPAIK